MGNGITGGRRAHGLTIPERYNSATRVESLARNHTENAIDTLAQIMKHPECPPAARVKACEVLLNRGWGMPRQHINLEGDERRLEKIVREIVYMPPPEEIESIEDMQQDPIEIDMTFVRGGNGNGSDSQN